VDVLKCLYVAPSPLLFNSWAFIRGFKVLCEGFGFQSSLAIFLHFYGKIGEDNLSWISISTHHGMGLFPTYASNPKNWRETYLRVYGAAGFAKATVRVDGELKFPLSWTNNPTSINGYDYEKMSAYERDMVSFFGENVAHEHS
jgi:hypothetical protein